MDVNLIANRLQVYAQGTTTAAAMATTNFITTFTGAATTFVSYREIASQPMKISYIGVLVTTPITVANGLLTVTIQPTWGSTTNARTVGTLTLASSGSTTNDLVVNYLGDSDNREVSPGEEVIFTMTTACTGAGIPILAMYPHLVGSQAAGTVTKPYGTPVGSIKVVAA